MPTWPAYAKILYDGFAVEPESAVLRSEMESGPAKQVRVVSRVLHPRPMTVGLDSRDDYAAFKAWIKNDIAHGAAWFDWTDPIDGITKQARIVEGKVAYRPVNALANAWRAQLALETWE